MPIKKNFQKIQTIKKQYMKIVKFIAKKLLTLLLFSNILYCKLTSEVKMSKFRVMVVMRNGKPAGVRAASINGRVIILALRDEPDKLNWFDAVKIGIPSKEEWIAIAENLVAINKALVRAGGEPLKKGWYWSSSEYSSYRAWVSYFLSTNGLYFNFKGNSNSQYVRPVLAF